MTNAPCATATIVGTGLGQWLEKAFETMPEGVRRGVLAVTTRARSLAEWVDGHVRRTPALKLLGAAASAAIFAFLWFNTTEVSWDIPELVRGFTGGMSFVELFQSLPETAVGLLLRTMFPGLPSGLMWNAMLPITIALRLAWLHRRRLVEWSHGRVTALWETT